MRKFIVKIIVFIIPLCFIFSSGILVPTTPRASKSLLISKRNKDYLLCKTPNPRIIFVGGSNLSFGLNSQTIKDSLQLNPINTAIHASIGIKFMLDNTLDYIQNGDIVVLVPEYNHYYRSLNFGSDELLRTIMDEKIEEIKHLNIFQIGNILEYLPKYSLSKFNPSEYLNTIESDIYSVNSFNQFGDAYIHWSMEKQEFPPFCSINDELNYDVINYLEEVNIAVKKKGGAFFVSFPGFQEASFNNSKVAIRKVQDALFQSSLTVIGSPERYKMPDSLMFNTPYHLNKNGVDYRTSLLIQDIEKALTHKK